MPAARASCPIAIVLGLLPVCLGLCLYGCRKEPQPQPPPPATRPAAPIVIGYSAPDMSNAQSVIMKGFVRQAKAMGWEVKVTNADFSHPTQMSQINFLISQKVRAIVAVPVDSRGIAPAIRNARQAGIPFYTIDRAPAGEKVNMVVLSDNFLAGKQAGEAMVRLLTQIRGSPKGVVLELQGDMKTNVAQLRGQGFHSVVDAYPEIKVVPRQTHWRAARFASETQAVLETTQIHGIFMHADSVGVSAVLPILKQRGLLFKHGHKDHICITTIDATPSALEAIRQRYVDHASSQPLPDFGLIARWIDKEIKGQPITPEVVSEPGAPWSPATVRMGDAGWELVLATTAVTIDNVDTPRLWGNQPP